MVDYSRSTVANVETGRQHVPRDFWENADAACHAGGALIEASDAIEAAVRQEHEEAAHQTRSLLLGLAGDSGVGAAGLLVHAPAVAIAAPGDSGEWLDAIAIAASEARDHAERAALTKVGPGMVEQLTADVARLSRAYVSAPPLPVFAAMGQALGRIHSLLGEKAYPAQARDLNFLAGVLCGLMANACLDLGREEAADDLARAAWTHGRIVDHDPLMGWARGTQALAAIWDQRYPDAARHAEDGLIYVSAGVGAARVHAIHARALAAVGDQAQPAPPCWPPRRPARTRIRTSSMTASPGSSRSMTQSSVTTRRYPCSTPRIRPEPSTLLLPRSASTRQFRYEPVPTAVRPSRAFSSRGHSS